MLMLLLVLLLLMFFFGFAFCFANVWYSRPATDPATEHGEMSMCERVYFFIQFFLRFSLVCSVTWKCTQPDILLHDILEIRTHTGTTSNEVSTRWNGINNKPTWWEFKRFLFVATKCVCAMVTREILLRLIYMFLLCVCGTSIQCIFFAFALIVWFFSLKQWTCK